MLSVDSARAQLAALLSGQLVLDDFEGWLVGASWNVLQHVDAEVRQLIGAIELRLAEYSSGHLEQGDLLAELQALLVYGCVREPIQSLFISIGNPSELITLTVSEGRPDFMFQLGKSQTSPMTYTGSAKTIVRDRVPLAS